MKVCAGVGSLKEILIIQFEINSMIGVGVAF